MQPLAGTEYLELTHPGIMLPTWACGHELMAFSAFLAHALAVMMSCLGWYLSAHCLPNIKNSSEARCDIFWDPELTGTYLGSKFNNDSLPKACLFVISSQQGTCRFWNWRVLPLWNVVEILKSVSLTQDFEKTHELMWFSVLPSGF